MRVAFYLLIMHSDLLPSFLVTFFPFLFKKFEVLIEFIFELVFAFCYLLQMVKIVRKISCRNVVSNALTLCFYQGLQKLKLSLLLEGFLF